MKSRRDIHSFLLVIAVCLAAGCAPRQTHEGFESGRAGKKSETLRWSLPERLKEFKLLPGENRIRFGEDNLWEYMNGGAQQVLLLGFRCLFVGRYGNADKGQNVLLEVYRMKTVKAAGALFDLWGTSRGTTGSVCGRSWQDHNLITFLVGRDYVRIVTLLDEEDRPRMLEELGREVCERLQRM